MTKLCDQPQPFQLFGVFRAGGHQIDPRSIDGGVPQNVRQLHDVPAGFVEDPGEEMAQVVGKDLGGRHLGLPAQGLHLMPDLPP